MTIRIPPENGFDRVLRYLGKERQIVLSKDAIRMCNELGPYVQINAKREGFISALFRRKCWVTENLYEGLACRPQSR